MPPKCLVEILAEVNNRLTHSQSRTPFARRLELATARDTNPNRPEHHYLSYQRLPELPSIRAVGDGSIFQTRTS